MILACCGNEPMMICPPASAFSSVPSLPAQAPFAPHTRTTAAVLVFIFTPTQQKNHCQHRARPCLCTDHLPTADACSSPNLLFCFRRLQAQVPSPFICQWWITMFWVWCTKKKQAHNLFPCLPFLRAPCCGQSGSWRRQLAPVAYPHNQSMKASDKHLVLTGLCDGCAQVPWVTG